MSRYFPAEERSREPRGGKRGQELSLRRRSGANISLQMINRVLMRTRSVTPTVLSQSGLLRNRFRLNAPKKTFSHLFDLFSIFRDIHGNIPEIGGLIYVASVAASGPDGSAGG